jgi:hypothetical protein
MRPTTTHTTQVVTPFGSGYVAEQHAVKPGGTSGRLTLTTVHTWTCRCLTKL